MARNHRGFVEATVAAAKLGADVLYLNTAFAGPQLVDVLEREKPTVVVHDEEFTDMLEKARGRRRGCWRGPTATVRPSVDTLDELIEGGPRRRPRAPERHSRIVILTSGTTGTPKGAPRNEAGIDAAVSLLSRMPLRFGWSMHIAAPLFHTWGFAHLDAVAAARPTRSCSSASSTPRRRWRSPTRRCDSMVVIPVMLQRILALPDETLGQLRPAAVKVVAASGSALPGDLALDWMDHFGDNLYNIYGSTEVAYASIATPEDLRAAARHRGQAAVGDRRQDLRRAGPAGPPRASRAGSSSATGCSSRATPAAARRT